MAANDPNAILQQAIAALRAGQSDQARRLLEALPPQLHDHPDRLQLLAMACKGLGDLERAETLLRRSLAANPRQPAVHGNLANLLRQLKRLEDAERHYRLALEIDPTFADAQRNLGLLLAATERHDEAVEQLMVAIRSRPTDVAAWTTLGQSLRVLDRLDDAVKVFERALQLQPGYGNAELGLAETLRRMARYDAARGRYDAALRSLPDSPEALRGRADLCVDEGDLEGAEQRLRALLERHPGDVAAHVQLNELLWQLGRQEAYGESFRRALAERPADAALLAGWLTALTAVGRHREVLELAAGHRASVDAHAELARLVGRACGALGLHDEAIDRLRAALQREPLRPETGLDLAQVLIVTGDYDGALDVLETVAAQRPTDQLMWACRGLCWRLLGDARADWLTDYDRFVATYRIAVPPGFDSLATYLDGLSERLTAMHRTRVAPTNQTLRGGTQTFGRLLHREEPLILALKTAFEDAVRQHVASLPKGDAAHPLLGRIPADPAAFRFSGSWSVRLRGGGYHVNHVHPAGWLSSAFYVEVPDDLGSSPAAPAGWLKLGESDLGLGDRELIARTIRPRAGELTLFPSYCWHGTVPFESEQPRLTAPFDVVPG